MFLQAHTNWGSSFRCLSASGFFFAAFTLLTSSASAQDSLRLCSFGSHSTYNNPVVVFLSGTFISATCGQGATWHPHTAALSARYQPALNPLLLWKYDYPLTEQQMQERDRRYRMENDLRDKIASDVVQSIFSRKKIKPVKPTL